MQVMTPGRTVVRRGDETVTTTVKPFYQLAVCKCGQRHHHESVQEKVRRSSSAFGVRSTESVRFFDTAPQQEKCSCGRPIRWKGIKGTTNSTPCSAKCTNSKGFVCDCSCGDKNHGIGSRL